MEFNTVKAFVNPYTARVKRGGTFKAEIFIAAYDSTLETDVVIDGKKNTTKPNEYIEIETANTIGKHALKGEIQFLNPHNGENIRYPFESEYEIIE